MDDAVARYCQASAQRDIEALMTTLADDVEVVSPLSARAVFRDRADIRTLLGAVYETLADLRWGEQVGDGRVRLAVGEGRVARLRLGDAMVFELAEDGRIQRVRPHLRPWLATTVFAVSLAAKLAGDPAILARAMRAS